ncbi:hypothetical protein [Chloroflexus sp.]|uniref:hypothetical protein n=1 Tax=Chloroflexus sp. TaxID=1904827 RepID=UPI00262A9101|nr:hypothetical protein [uncultured Chloroflexus sp.]
MYGNNGNGPRQSYVLIGGYPVKPIYLIILGVIVFGLLVYFLLRFFNIGLTMHFSAFAGILLLIANLRELLGAGYTQRGSTALLNTLVGGGLIFAWLAQFFVLFWLPALLAVGIATPLVLNRSGAYTIYLTTAQQAVERVRRTMVR